MDVPIKLLSTDFDGTLYADFENPPVPLCLQSLIRGLQSRGAKWVINTGRALPDLLLALEQAELGVEPDYLVVVEREIYRRHGDKYVEARAWNESCRREHTQLFERITPDLSRIQQWIRARFDARVYADAYSPVCLQSRSNEDTDAIVEFLEEYCRSVTNLTVVRNDVYARFSHVNYNKGSALGEIARQLRIGPDGVLAAGDHWNDLPMLSQEFARWLVAPDNAIEAVKKRVRQQQGYVSGQAHGYGVARGVEFFLEFNHYPLSDLG